MRKWGKQRPFPARRQQVQSWETLGGTLEPHSAGDMGTDSCGSACGWLIPAGHLLCNHTECWIRAWASLLRPFRLLCNSHVPSSNDLQFKSHFSPQWYQQTALWKREEARALGLKPAPRDSVFRLHPALTYQHFAAYRTFQSSWFWSPMEMGYQYGWSFVFPA